MTPDRLITLAPVDLAIIVLYFLMVLGIGFYLRRFATSGEDFFLAGREMTAWVAGLQLPLQRILGSLELLGWAGACLSSTASSLRTGIGSEPFPRCSSSASS